MAKNTSLNSKDFHQRNKASQFEKATALHLRKTPENRFDFAIKANNGLIVDRFGEPFLACAFI